MKLSKVYEEITIRDAWTRLEQALEETILLEEGNNKLASLLSESDKLIFPAFGIDKGEKKYFIAGSARLYLYQG